MSVGSLVVSFCTYLFSFLLFLTTPEIAAAMVQGDTREVCFHPWEGATVLHLLCFLTINLCSDGGKATRVRGMLSHIGEGYYFLSF